MTPAKAPGWQPTPPGALKMEPYPQRLYSRAGKGERQKTAGLVYFRPDFRGFLYPLPHAKFSCEVCTLIYPQLSAVRTQTDSGCSGVSAQVPPVRGNPEHTGQTPLAPAQQGADAGKGGGHCRREQGCLYPC